MSHKNLQSLRRELRNLNGDLKIRKWAHQLLMIMITCQTVQAMIVRFHEVCMRKNPKTAHLTRSTRMLVHLTVGLWNLMESHPNILSPKNLYQRRKYLNLTKVLPKRRNLNPTKMLSTTSWMTQHRLDHSNMMMVFIRVSL